MSGKMRLHVSNETIQRKQTAPGLSEVRCAAALPAEPGLHVPKCPQQYEDLVNVPSMCVRVPAT